MGCHVDRQGELPLDEDGKRGQVKEQEGEERPVGEDLEEPPKRGLVHDPRRARLGYAEEDDGRSREGSAGIGEEERHEAPLRDQPADDQANREGEVDGPVHQAVRPGPVGRGDHVRHGRAHGRAVEIASRGCEEGK